MSSGRKKAPAKKLDPEKSSTQTPAQESGQEFPKQYEPEHYEPTIKSPDDVIGSIGPQAMALLASGQTREHEGGASFQL